MYIVKRPHRLSYGSRVIDRPVGQLEDTEADKCEIYDDNDDDDQNAERKTNDRIP